MHSMDYKIITTSLCPVCMKKIDAFLQSDYPIANLKQFESEQKQNESEVIRCISDKNQHISGEKQNISEDICCMSDRKQHRSREKRNISEGICCIQDREQYISEKKCYIPDRSQHGSEEISCITEMNQHQAEQGQNIYMIKKCPEHGEFRTLVWKGSTRIESWIRNKIPAQIKHPITSVEKGCPFDCGICSNHRQHTCTALIEVTQNCNLNCTYCFADSHALKKEEPSLEVIQVQFTNILKVSGHCNIQLSGGEPTIRDDLYRIIEIGKESGFTFIQVNTNGIRLAKDFAYTKKLKEAGLASVFLQFDGTKDDIYKSLRGRELMDIKKKAIEHCKELNIGVVLVPTLVPGVNVDNIGEILEFGMAHAPTVRGVHFQPVSYFGRVPFEPGEENRITLPEVMDEISLQTKGRIPIETLKPPGCENSLCSFHGNYTIEENNRIKSTTFRSSCGCSSEPAEEGAKKAITFVNKKWSSPAVFNTNKSIKVSQQSDWDKILEQISNKSFSISAMAFQDVWNVNLERIKDCCIHVSTPDGRLIPFCLYNITNSQGEYLYRK